MAASTALMLSLGMGSAEATTRAVITGASGYPNLASSLRLAGPKNDTRAFANSLARSGIAPGNITVLADQVIGLDDGIVSAGPATKAAILAALDRLVTDSGTGDLAVFYFSGHGSRQPDQNGDEEGGLDEIFLPYDAKTWGGKGVDNALIDDELGERVQKILDKGADFFGVIDACHSATGFRDVLGDDARVRGVDPAELGVPSIAVPTVRPVARKVPAAKPGRGRAAFFYAAQETEEALEKTPPGAADGESYGVFTYTMIARMNASPGLTYRALHQAVVADIKRNALMATQTPEEEGELLDEPVLRQAAVPSEKRWPIFAGKLQAGALDGVGPGAVLALYDDAAAPDNRPIAYGKVDAGGATVSHVTPAALPCKEASGCAQSVDDTVFKKSRFARLMEKGIDFKVTLSPPLRIESDDGEDYGPALAAFKEALASPKLAQRVSVTSTGYDIAVGLVDGTLAFAPAAGLIDSAGAGSSPRLTLPPKASEASAKVEEALASIARATALQRLGGNARSGEDLGFSARVLSRRSAKPPAAGGSCPKDDANYSPAAAVNEGAAFRDCDILSIAMENNGRKALDVTVLLVGSDFSITPVWPVEGNSNRIELGEKRQVDILQMEPDPKASSQERLIFLTVPGINRAHVAFTDLEQLGVRSVNVGDSPEIEALRDVLAAGLNAMARGSIAAPAALQEDMAIDIKPFFVAKGQGG